MKHLNSVTRLPSNGAATKVIATSDADANIRATADYVLDGTNDYVEIQAAIDAMNDGEILTIVGPTVTLGATGIDFGDLSNFQFLAPATTIKYSGTGVAIEWTPASQTYFSRIDALVEFTGDAITSGTARAFKLGAHQFGDFKLRYKAVNSGGALEIVTLSPSLYFECNGLWMSGYAHRHIIFTGDYSFAYNYLNQADFDLSDAADNAVCLDFSNNTWDVVSWQIPKINVWPHATNTNTVIKSNGTSDIVIDHLMVDGVSGKGAALTIFDAVETDLRVKRLTLCALDSGRIIRSTEGVSAPYIDEIYEDGVKLVGGAGEIGEQLSRTVIMPVALAETSDMSDDTGSRWTTSAGVAVQSGAGVSAVGGAAISCELQGNEYSSWDEYFSWKLRVQRSGSATNAVGYIQIKPTTAVGALAGHGLGIRMDNLAMKGISYGSGGAEEAVDLSVDMTQGIYYNVEIRFYPGVKIEWYVNGVLKGTQSTTTKIPSSGGDADLVCSIAKAADGATNCKMYVCGGTMELPL
jgi:hypothetical protein